MAAVALTVDASEAIAGLGRLGGIDTSELVYNVGALLESSTQARIADEKRSPEGEAWVPWSERYDETRDHTRHSLLVGSGAPGLLSSIQNYSTADEVRVGTPLVYGAIHQFGSGDLARPTNIPARPYLGLSPDDRLDIEDLVTGAIEQALA